MKRRDFNRIVLGAGVSPVFAKSSFAQMSPEEVPTTPAKAAAPNIIIKNSPRTYNQVNVPRKYTAGRRRFTIYWTWSYPWEANRDVTELDNRFSTMTEVRRVGWPRYEEPQWSEREFLQGIAGTLELFHLSTVRFQNLVGEATGHPVVVYQRVDQAGQQLPVDEAILGDTDTMMIFGLDHMITEQEASAEEIEAVRKFLTREGTCLLIGPHHDVGVSSDPAERQMEYAHHGDPLVPRQQRFGLYTRSLMKGLGVPVENSMGPAARGLAGYGSDCSVDRHEGSGYARVAYRRFNVQFPPPPAALCADNKRCEVGSRFGTTAHGYVAPAPVHGSRESRVQYIPLDAAKRDTSRRYFAR